MTDTNQSPSAPTSMRERFESWAFQKGSRNFTKEHGGRWYEDDSVEDRWQTWQACEAQRSVPEMLTAYANEFSRSEGAEAWGCLLAAAPPIPAPDNTKEAEAVRLLRAMLQCRDDSSDSLDCHDNAERARAFLAAHDSRATDRAES